MDSRTQRSGRSPSVSPDRGSTPTSPYSVPQIAPLPSSTLCPICKTSDLTSTPSQPNFNTCTQCHSKVCNQCGFNPNPHLTQVSTAAPPHLPAPPLPLPSPLSPALSPSHVPWPPASVSSWACILAPDVAAETKAWPRSCGIPPPGGVGGPRAEALLTWSEFDLEKWRCEDQTSRGHLPRGTH